MELHEIYIDKIYEYNDKTFDNGIDYVKHRRLHENWNEPVVFTSFQPLNNILTKKGTSIITTIGHVFLQIPYTKKEVDEIKEDLYELDTIDLNDIKLHYCQISGVFSNTFHNFKARLQAIFNTKTESKIKEIISEQFEIFYSELNKEFSFIPNYSTLIAELEKYKGEIITNLDNPPINEQQERFLKYIPNEEAVSELDLGDIKSKPWKVLFLEDNPDEIKNVTDILEIKQIKFKVFESYKEAEAELEMDKSNDYTVVISDFRLNNGNRQQTKQGYKFLIETAKKNRLNALIALSGLSKWFLMDSFRNEGLDIKVFSKGAIVGNGANFFVDEIENLGEKYHDALMNKPEATAWKNHLKPYYAAYRISKDYQKIEEKICQHSSEIVEEIKQVIFDKNNPMKNMHSISTYISEAQANFDNKTYKAINETTLKKFYDKLIIRRILIYMYLWDENCLNTVCELLAYNLSDKKVDKKKDDNEKQKATGNKKQIMTNCGLKEEEIPVNILSEEINWLDKMGVEIKGYKVAFNELYDLFVFFFTHYPVNTIKDQFKTLFTKDKSIIKDKSLKSIERNFKALNKGLKKNRQNKDEIIKFYNNLRKFLYVLQEAYNGKTRNKTIDNFLKEINGQ